MRPMAMIAVLGVVLVAGCIKPNSEPIERAKNDAVAIVTPVMTKALADLGTRTAAMQGQGSLINPGYNIKGFGIVGTGFVWDATVQVTGVSANIAGSTQADNQASPKPAATTQPAPVP